MFIVPHLVRNAPTALRPVVEVVPKLVRAVSLLSSARQASVGHQPNTTNCPTIVKANSAPSQFMGRGIAATPTGPLVLPVLTQPARRSLSTQPENLKTLSDITIKTTGDISVISLTAGEHTVTVKVPTSITEKSAGIEAAFHFLSGSPIGLDMQQSFDSNLALFIQKFELDKSVGTALSFGYAKLLAKTQDIPLSRVFINSAAQLKQTIPVADFGSIQQPKLVVTVGLGRVFKEWCLSVNMGEDRVEVAQAVDARFRELCKEKNLLADPSNPSPFIKDFEPKIIKALIQQAITDCGYGLDTCSLVINAGLAKKLPLPGVTGGMYIYEVDVPQADGSVIPMSLNSAQLFKQFEIMMGIDLDQLGLYVSDIVNLGYPRDSNMDMAAKRLGINMYNLSKEQPSSASTPVISPRWNETVTTTLRIVQEATGPIVMVFGKRAIDEMDSLKEAALVLDQPVVVKVGTTNLPETKAVFERLNADPGY